MRLFVSYRRQDTEGYVLTLPIVLQQAGLMPPIDLFVDADKIPTGTNFVERMLDAVKSCDAVLACIVDRSDQANANGGVDLASLLLPPAATSASTVDALADLLYVPLTPAERTQLITYLDSSYDRTTQQVTPSPFNPANPTHVSERVRGLLYILAQHPSYAIR